MPHPKEAAVTHFLLTVALRDCEPTGATYSDVVTGSQELRFFLRKSLDF